jgi:hypothetical protein
MTALLLASVVGAAGPAGAKAKHHHQSGKGGASAPITIQIDPNPLVESGTSDVVAVVQVETSPAFAGDLVNIDSSQLQSACGGEIAFLTAQGIGAETKNSVQVFLDNEGNVSVIMYAAECAPGTSLVEADLESTPYYTALGSLLIEPPTVTTEGVSAFPTTSGTATGGEVESDDSATSLGAGDNGCNSPPVPCTEDSVVYAVFYVETSPVYAEQQVEISSDQLQSRCGEKYAWGVPGGSAGAPTLNFTYNSTGPYVSTVDDDGNAVFAFYGESCAAGSSLVTADVVAGTHPTYTTTFNVLPPQPTI